MDPNATCLHVLIIIVYRLCYSEINGFYAVNLWDSLSEQLALLSVEILKSFLLKVFQVSQAHKM